jgi:poly [ADP-ribose] polymerase
MKAKRLICVEVDNVKTGVKQSNKFYNMTEVGDGNFKVEYGRVGNKVTSRIYPMSMWDSQLRKKLKKYEDITHLHNEEVTVQRKDTGISNATIAKLFGDLQNYAGKTVSENYRISANSVTQKMLDKAQEIIDTINKNLSKNSNVEQVNNQLLELYKTIPRKMNNVKKYLVNSLVAEYEIKSASKMLKNEQDTLDTMVGQVLLHEATESTDPEKHEDILEKLGLNIEVANPAEHKDIEKGLGQNAHRLIKAYKVVNTKTTSLFKDNLKKSKNKSTDMFFHGSRNQNWFNILQTGLLIRPSGAIHTGSMFGDGLYGANKAQKAIGYSSMRGSYWTSGSDNKGFIGIFEFHTGKQKVIKRHDSSCYSLSRQKLTRDGFDSVYAKGGIDLRNDEFIVYDSSQCTIRYILEMKN